MLLKYLFTILLTAILAQTDANAQTLTANWIAHPVPTAMTQQWFRKDVFFDEHPLSAFVTLATTGYVELYVNERNVGTDVLAPYRTDNSDTPMTVSYDVNRFLRRGMNTIAVWYAPANGKATDRQISFIMNGIKADSSRYVVNSDRSWLCKEAAFRMNIKGGEDLDGRADRLSWKGELTDVACWVGAEEASSTLHARNTGTLPHPAPLKLLKVVVPRQTFMRGDTVVYDFGEGFFGQLRATLRGTKKGERINVENLRYVCKSVIDEQIYHKFSTGHWRQVYVWGDSRFRKEQVEVMEGLVIGTEGKRFQGYNISLFEQF